MRPGEASNDNPFGLVLFQCPTLVLAAGGPGEMFRDSVFPNGCFGSLGMALEAGLELVNITEHQFGIGTPTRRISLEPLGNLCPVHPAHLFAR